MARLPLEGIRVADFSWIIKGPQIAQWLATMGAEVIKIESQVYIDIGRTNPAGMADRVAGVNRSGFYHALNYGKKAIRLNLRAPKGRDLAHEIIRSSDFVLECFPGSVRRKTRPHLRRSAKGQVRHHHDFGLAARQNRTRTVPLGRMGPDGLLLRRHVRRPGLSRWSAAPDRWHLARLCDRYRSVVFHALAALRHRNRTGEGQWIDASMGETVIGQMHEWFTGLFHEWSRSPPTG